ncbi:hypothetical protein ACHAW6_013636 [Cyclotella cf. meneghiniana]
MEKLCKCSVTSFSLNLTSYYTFKTIITQFRKNKFLRLLMGLPTGLKCSPDVAQSIMESVLDKIHDAIAFSHDWGHYIKLLGTIYLHHQENGFTINPLKCEWAVKETNRLGYWPTPHCLKPWKKN